MSQNGRGLNGGVNELYFTLEFVYQLFNAARSFLVDSNGNVTCNNIKSTGTVTSNGYIQNTGSGPVNLENQIVILQGDVTTLNGEVATLNSEVSTLQSQVTTLNNEVGILMTTPAPIAWAVISWAIPGYQVNMGGANMTITSGISYNPAYVGQVGINYTGSLTPTYIATVTNYVPNGGSTAPIVAYAQTSTSANLYIYGNPAVGSFHYLISMYNAQTNVLQDGAFLIFLY